MISFRPLIGLASGRQPMPFSGPRMDLLMQELCLETAGFTGLCRKGLRVVVGLLGC